jgi:multidrug efflux pump subunit AcrA (membrane-fusion protein)
MNIANLAQNKDSKSKIKVFPVQIKITGKSGNLLPGLTVSCKIIVSEIKDVLFVPIETVFKDQSNEFVYVRTGSVFKRRDVKIGTVNSDFALVKEGLNENEELALTDPFLNKEEDKTKTGTNGK